MHRAYHPTPEIKRRPFRWWSLLPWVAAVYVATGFYTVQPDEQAVVRRCGRRLSEIRQPGLHFGFPWPVDRISRLKVRQAKPVAVGMTLADRDLGRRVQPKQSESLTGDRNLVVAGAVVHYRIADPIDYLLNTTDVTALVRGTTAGALSSAISSMHVDDVLTVERVRIQNEVRQAVQTQLDTYGAGVYITSVSLEGMEAPQEVADAFADVTRARADKERMISEAKGYAGRLHRRTAGEAERIRLEAEGYAEEVLQKAHGDCERFTQMAAELDDARALTTKRLILETMEEVLPRLRKIVLDRNQAADVGLFEANP